jgi:hypothetical protein
MADFDVSAKMAKHRRPLCIQIVSIRYPWHGSSSMRIISLLLVPVIRAPLLQKVHLEKLLCRRVAMQAKRRG